jgi:hypothetical protein
MILKLYLLFMKRSILVAKIRGVLPGRTMIMLGMVICFFTAHSQTVPVNQMNLDGDLRNLQLMGKLDLSHSFTARPFFQYTTGKSKKNITGNDTIDFIKQIDPATLIFSRRYIYKTEKAELALLPAQFITKFNSHHPYGWNDEGMMAAKGLQTELSAGIFAKFSFLSVQFQPQFVYAANSYFDTSAAYGPKPNGAFNKILPGQSSIRLNLGAVSLGYSTENLWWGPGQFSSLLMSNNAPGFAHITFNTTRPLKTAVGSFEFQLIGGRLDEDSAANRPYEHLQLRQAALTGDWRYLNAIVFTYQPSFLPDFFIGFSRSFQLYNKNLTLQSSAIEKYLPVFTALFKNSTSDEDAKGRDQGISLFSRMIFPKSHAEFYFEYGWNDHSANSRDFLLDPEHSAAYIVGGKKLVPLAKDRWLEFTGEITQMAQSPDYIVRNAGNWYEHGVVLQGLTHQNQVLGAGSGMGNNVQTFTVNWLDGIKKMGFLFQRIQHDPSALAGDFGNIGLRQDGWNEVAFGIQSRWDFKKILASVELQHTVSDNYAWVTGNKKGNLYGLLKIAYTW